MKRETHALNCSFAMMRRLVVAQLVIGLLVESGVGFAQAASTPLAFEVATVKPSAPLDMSKLAAEVQAGRMPNFGPHVDAARATYTYMPLKELIALAYGVKSYQITGPPWLASERFDIEAKMPDNASKDDAPRMLQALLNERFKLVVHRDTQEHSVLGLVVGKNGPKLKPSPATTTAIDDNAPLKPGETKITSEDQAMRITKNSDGSTTINMGAKGTITQRMDTENKSIHIDASRVTMAGFAEMLTRVMQMGDTSGRQVVDMTGLEGNYQVSLEISLADIMGMARAQGFAPAGAVSGAGSGEAPAAAASDPGGATVFRSVQELGLKLEPRKANVEQLVIDHVEKTPTEN